MKTFENVFSEMTSPTALFDAWWQFRRGKAKRHDVQEFGRFLEKNVFRLHRDLHAKRYRHGAYESFYVHDPKVRHIRKASVRDRLVHQTVSSALSRIYEPRFIEHAYSSRIGKGTHRGVNALRDMTRKVSRNYTGPCWALKCDVRKFYDTVDHDILLHLLGQTVRDSDALWLTDEIVRSFYLEGTAGKGVPIGNLTSQIFTNVYLNELDQFIKHRLRVKFYLRYADDLVALSERKADLQELLVQIERFLHENLRLTLHPQKIVLRPLEQGIDFLGYVTLPRHRMLRTTTERRMRRRIGEKHVLYCSGGITEESLNQCLQSYLGIMSHADTYELGREVKNQFCWR